MNGRSLAGTTWVLVVAAGWGCAPGDQAEPSDEPVRVVVDDEAYRFCHEPGREEARRWCEILDEVPEEACPGLRQTCEEPPAEPGGCTQQPDASEAPAAPPEPPRSDGGCDNAPSASAGGFFAALVQWTVALLVALMVVGFGLVLLRWIQLRLARRPAPTEGTVPAPAALVADPEAVPEAPSGDLLDLARAAFADARFDEAVFFARAAALRALGDRGKVHLHRSRTDREYLREVAGEPEVHRPLHEVVRAVEAIRWGGRRAVYEMAEAALRHAERVVRLIAVLGLLTGLVASRPARAEEVAYQADGLGALVEVLGAAGWDARFRLRPLGGLAPDEDVDVLVLDATAVGLSEEALAALRAWVQAGGIAVIGGSDDGFPELGELGLRRSDEAPVSWAPVAEAGLGAPRWPSAPSWAYQVGDGTVWVGTGVESDPEVFVQSLRLGSGAILGFADLDPLRNAGLTVPRNVAFAGRLLDAGQEAGLLPDRGRVIEVVTSGRAAGASSAWESLANTRLLPVVLQLLLVTAVAALWKGRAFGPLRPDSESDRHGFVEHVVTLGTRFRRARARRHAASSYAALWLSRLGPHGLEAAARRAGHTPEQARALLDRARHVAEHRGGRGSASDLDLVEELWKIASHRRQ